MAKKFLCETPACTLGTAGNPGRFTGGITKDQLNVLTGAPIDQMKSGEHFGAGFCPNCGVQGRELTAEDVKQAALDDAKAAYEAQVAAINGGV